MLLNGNEALKHKKNNLNLKKMSQFWKKIEINLNIIILMKFEDLKKFKHNIFEKVPKTFLKETIKNIS